MKNIKVVIYGYKGKMGEALLRLLPTHSRLQLVGKIGTQTPLIELESIFDQADVVIDFSTPEALNSFLPLAVKKNLKMILGTTGYQQEEIEAIYKAAVQTPILFAPNFSIGVNTLFWLTKKATELLGPEYDAEIIETHHRFKKDAPSGTAIQLGKMISKARNENYDDHVCHGRQGNCPERTRKEIGMHSLRVGDVAGDHTVILGTLGERLELTYRASNRDVFAQGALVATKWIADQPAGLYDMQDLLGLSTK